jgi:hypothetical protein
MSDPYDAVHRAAHDLVQGQVSSILSEIAAGNITDEDQLTDAIHEHADGAITYTRDQYLAVWGLRDEEDAIEEGLCTPSCFGDALAAQAYCNMRSAISEHMEEFTEALQVAADATEENTPEDPREEVTP